MTSERDVTGILRDISLLYELSLSVGGSIELDDNCDGFLRTLMARKSLDFASVWIRGRFVQDLEEGAEEAIHRVYANPAFRAPTDRIPLDHPIVRRLLSQPIFSLAHGEPGFDELVTESGIDRGAYAIYRLGRIGFLKLYSIARDSAFPLIELSKLRHVVEKFTVSLEGCLDHARVREAEERRRDLELQVLHAQKLESLGLLAGGMAHDFNNLLSVILGNAELARDEQEPREELGNIEVAARRAADLCAQLLAYSGRGHFDNRSVDLNEVLREMLKLTTVTVSKKARVVRDLAAELPPIHGDRSQIGQVVMNLMTNASEALGEVEGVLMVSSGLTSATPEDLSTYHLGEGLSGGDYVFLEVEDSGCGMDPETLERLFDPFFTTKFAGRGLGLAAVLGIVRRHRGAIRIESGPGEGTRVRLLFPATLEPAATPPVRPDTDRADDLRGLALVIDDEEHVRRTIAKLLTTLGFDVLQARDGGEGIDAYESHGAELDLVVLDSTMPVLDGDEVLARIRAIDPNAPVVFTSGYMRPRASTEDLQGAAVTFLSKPFGLEDLRRAVIQSLGARSAVVARPSAAPVRTAGTGE